MIKMKSTDKVSTSKLFISDGDEVVELLRIVPKSAGFYVYLPHCVAEALNLSKDDHSLICFIDNKSNYTYLILTKDRDLAEQLRPVILSKRQKAEALHKKLREEIEAQRQQAEAATSVSQEYV